MFKSFIMLQVNYQYIDFFFDIRCNESKYTPEYIEEVVEFSISFQVSWNVQLFFVAFLEGVCHQFNVECHGIESFNVAESKNKFGTI